MSGTWAILWPSGQPYRFYQTHAEAVTGAIDAERVQWRPFKVVLWR